MLSEKSFVTKVSLKYAAYSNNIKVEIKLTNLIVLTKYTFFNFLNQKI